MDFSAQKIVKKSFETSVGFVSLVRETSAVMRVGTTPLLRRIVAAGRRYLLFTTHVDTHSIRVQPYKLPEKSSRYLNKDNCIRPFFRKKKNVSTVRERDRLSDDAEVST